ncbi:MAG: energy-coupled thiamine transporter ThiT [Bacillota bacterium]|nr:energy-coupled thiamine transporter ThiT [Bacillota bacterium]
MKYSKTRKITTSALLIALSFVLMLISKAIPGMPQGGSVTLASMVPLIILSLIFDIKWGLASAFVYSLLEMAIQFYPPPTKTFLYFALVILLDYVFAFACLGLAGGFYRLMGKKIWAIPVSGLIVTTLRYICHILSGILIWGVYAKKGQSVLAYSLIYNGSYMIPNIIITTAVLVILAKFISERVENKI